MSGLAHAVAFLLGAGSFVFLAVALYRILDVWHCIRAQLGRTSAGIARAVLAVAILAWLLPSAYRESFWWGGASFLIFHVAGSYAVQLGLSVAVRRRAKS